MAKGRSVKPYQELQQIRLSKATMTEGPASRNGQHYNDTDDQTTLNLGIAKVKRVIRIRSVRTKARYANNSYFNRLAIPTQRLNVQ